MKFKQIKKNIQQSTLGKKLIKADLGRFKAWYQRVALYITGLNFLMIFHNFTLQNDWFPWYAWLFTIAVCVSSVLFIDIVFVWESEQNTTAKKNPVLMEMKKKVDYLYEKEKGRE